MLTEPRLGLGRADADCRSPERWLRRGHLVREPARDRLYLHYASAWLALCDLYAGRWDDAAANASDVVARSGSNDHQPPDGAGGARPAAHAPRRPGRRRRCSTKRWRWPAPRHAAARRAGARGACRGGVPARRPRRCRRRGAARRCRWRVQRPTRGSSASWRSGAGAAGALTRRRRLRRALRAADRPAAGARRPRPGTGWAARTSRRARWPTATTPPQQRGARHLRAPRRAGPRPRPCGGACAGRRARRRARRPASPAATRTA